MVEFLWKRMIDRKDRFSDMMNVIKRFTIFENETRADYQFYSNQADNLNDDEKPNYLDYVKNLNLSNSDYSDYI